MTQGSDDLRRQTLELIDATDHLREALLEYRRGCERLLKAGEQGRRASSTLETLGVQESAEKRERVTSAIEAFEAARRRVRLGLVTVAQEEGSNLSDVAHARSIPATHFTVGDGSERAGPLNARRGAAVRLAIF